MKHELIRLTLRRHLRTMIEQETAVTPARRITNIDSWPEPVIARAYKRMGGDWDSVEEAGMRAQGTPGFSY